MDSLIVQKNQKENQKEKQKEIQKENQKKNKNMDLETFQKWVITSNLKNLIELSSILKLRLLSKNIKKMIDDVCLYHYMNSYKKAKEILYYDKSIYDNFSYKRTVVSNQFQIDYSKYSALQAPRVDDSGKLVKSNMPTEYFILLRIYKIYPSIKVKLFPIKHIYDMIDHQNKYLDSSASTSTLKSKNLDTIYTIPICYTKHFKKNKQDEQYISVLCYCYMVHKKSTSIFNGHFYSMDFNVDDMDNFKSFVDCVFEEIRHIIQQTSTEFPDVKYIPANIISKSKYFEEAFSEFYKKQYFNM